MFISKIRKNSKTFEMCISKIRKISKNNWPQSWPHTGLAPCWAGPLLSWPHAGLAPELAPELACPMLGWPGPALAPALFRFFSNFRNEHFEKIRKLSKCSFRKFEKFRKTAGPGPVAALVVALDGDISGWLEVASRSAWKIMK